MESSYQKLKEKTKHLEKLTKEYYDVCTKYAETLTKIATLKGPECLKAPEIALEAVQDYITMKRYIKNETK